MIDWSLSISSAIFSAGLCGIPAPIIIASNSASVSCSAPNASNFPPGCRHCFLSDFILHQNCNQTPAKINKYYIHYIHYKSSFSHPSFVPPKARLARLRQDKPPDPALFIPLGRDGYRSILERDNPP